MPQFFIFSFASKEALPFPAPPHIRLQKLRSHEHFPVMLQNKERNKRIDIVLFYRDITDIPTGNCNEKILQTDFQINGIFICRHNSKKGIMQSQVHTTSVKHHLSLIVMIRNRIVDDYFSRTAERRDRDN